MPKAIHVIAGRGARLARARGWRMRTRALSLRLGSGSCGASARVQARHRAHRPQRERAALAAAQGMIWPIVRHPTGYKFANDGRHASATALPWTQLIMHTVRYTELSPERFRNFWED